MSIFQLQLCEIGRCVADLPFRQGLGSWLAQLEQQLSKYDIKVANSARLIFVLFYTPVLIITYYSPAQTVKGSTLSELLDTP